MKTLVVYVSRQGCSEKSARLIQRALGAGCDIADLESEREIALDGYDTVVIGGPIYFGRLHAAVQTFCQLHYEALLQRRLGLYICCMQSGELARQELRGAFPPELLAHAAATGIFGGEIHMERINFIERFIVRAVVRSEYSITTFSEERVAHFVRQLLSV
jgi:menaquinone-dependent protoporphyrinogen oxidase